MNAKFKLEEIFWSVLVTSQFTETQADNTPEQLSAHSHWSTGHKLSYRFVQLVLCTLPLCFAHWTIKGAIYFGY